MEVIGSALAVIGPVVATAKAAIAMIDKQRIDAQKEVDTLKDLRIAIDALKRDATGYEVLLASILRTEDTRPLELLCKSTEGQEAFRNLDVALKAAKLLLEQNQVKANEGTSGLYGTRGQPDAKRPPIKDLIVTFLKANFTPDDGTMHNMQDTCKDLDVCRSNCESAFKMLWHLYVIHQQPPGRRASVDSHVARGELGRALDNILGAFYNKPFSIAPEGDHRVAYSSLTTLNKSHHSAKDVEETMKTAGKGWVESMIDNPRRRNSSTNSGKYISPVQSLGLLQTSLFELLWTSTVEQLKRHGAGTGDFSGGGASRKSDKEAQAFQSDLQDLEKGLQEAILRAKKQRFAIAFCGMVKAGKSLFLNALIGEPILPSDELPSTAWPCRLRHVPDQRVPVLEYDDGPFVSGIASLQRAKYGVKLESYIEPEEDEFGMMAETEPVEPTAEEVLLKQLHSQWVDLHSVTKANLRQFETRGFRLPKRAEGYEAVKQLLSQLNDVVRLCHRFNLNFQMEDVEWPLLSVEFNSLRGHHMDGVYEFIDLPGIGEQFDAFDFESMIRLVAKDSNAIVPILSFKELSRSDWKRLPDVVFNGFGGRAAVVVCTHLDQIKGTNKDEQMKTVTKVFWPGNINAATNNVIPCSSLMGLSARALLDLSLRGKPPFARIWDKDKRPVEYPAAERLLGTGQPEDTLSRMSEKTWRMKLEHTLEESGLPAAITKLTREMVDQAKQRAFQMEGEGVRKLLKKMSTAQERKLLEARRSKDEFTEAKRQYDQARANFHRLIDSWNVAEQQQQDNYHERMRRGIKSLRQKTEVFIEEAIQTTLREWSLGKTPTIEEADADGQPIGRGPRSARAVVEGGSTALVVKSVSHAEEFLRLSQRSLHVSLNGSKQDFVSLIRKMAEEARGKRFTELKEAFRRFDPNIQPDLREEIIEELTNQSVDIRQVVFNHIKNEIKTTKTRHTASTAFRAIEEKLAKPLLSQDAVEVITDDGEKKAMKTVDDLGFMLRAPISAVATIPFVFGLPIWPWIVHSQSIHLSMDVIKTRYRQEIVEPWLQALQDESQKALSGTISTSSKVARDAVVKALAREDDRYAREGDQKNSPEKAGMVQHMVAMQSNLYAAEAALLEIHNRLRNSL